MGLLERLAGVRAAGEERIRQHRRRYLALLHDVLRVSSRSTLPGPPSSWEEISRRRETWLCSMHLQSRHRRLSWSHLPLSWRGLECYSQLRVHSIAEQPGTKGQASASRRK